MLKSLGVTFTALKLSEGDDWPKAEYGIVALPRAFLLDSGGKIVWRPVVKSESEYRILESAIEALLTKETAEEVAK